jgi:hypothetical protein
LEEAQDMAAHLEAFMKSKKKTNNSFNENRANNKAHELSENRSNKAHELVQKVVAVLLQSPQQGVSELVQLQKQCQAILAL